MSAATVFSRMVIGLGATLTVLAAVFLLGPRNQFGQDIPTPRATPPADLAQLDSWLAGQESVFKDIVPGAAKGIVWHAGKRERAPWAVVNIHGFSASREEGAPLPELVAKALNAHRFEARLSGHGRGNGPPMGEPSVQDWLADVVEAVRIGRLLGDRLLVIGTSTGATLGTWMATQPDGKGIDALVFISPNFAPRNPQAQIANWPWGKQLVLALGGETRTWTPRPGAEKVWAYSYPMKAVFPMMSLVKHVQQMDLSGFTSPVLMLYSEADTVINPEAVKTTFARIPARIKKLEPVAYSDDSLQHNLASAIVAPKAIQPLSITIIDWVKSLPAKGS